MTEPGPSDTQATEADPADPRPTDSNPFETIRALAFAMPLAILAVAVVAPPDPVRQLLLTIGALAVAWPLSRRIVGRHDVSAHTLVAFFLAIAGVVLVGLWILSGTALEGVAARAARAVVVVVAVAAGYGLAIARTGR